MPVEKGVAQLGPIYHYQRCFKLLKKAIVNVAVNLQYAETRFLCVVAYVKKGPLLCRLKINHIMTVNVCVFIT